MKLLLLWIGGLMAAGYATLLGLFFVGISIALFNSWRVNRFLQKAHRSHCPAPFAPSHENGHNESEVNMKGLFGLLAALIVAFTLSSLLTGCSTWGNGQLDIPVDIDVTYTDNFGHEYQLIAGADGVELFVSASGQLYELSDDGFMITAPDGKGGTTKVRIKRLVPEPPADNPESLTARRHAHEAVG